MKTWRFLRLALIAVLALSLLLLIIGPPRLPYWLFGPGTGIVGICFALNIGGSAAGAVEDAARDPEKRPRWMRVISVRLYGIVLIFTGAAFTFMAVTGAGVVE